MRMHMKLLFELTNHLTNTQPEIVIDDFNRRYSETYMQLSTKTQPHHLVYVDNQTGMDFRIIDGEGKRIHHKWDDIISIEPWLPKTGYYQLPTQCIYLERRAAKQYKRSFTRNIYKHGELNHNLIVELYETWKAKPISYTLDEIDEDSPTIKLSNLLAAGYNSTKLGLVIYFAAEPIAQIKVHTKTLKLIVPKFKQELLDYLKRNQIFNWKVTE